MPTGPGFKPSSLRSPGGYKFKSCYSVNQGVCVWAILPENITNEVQSIYLKKWTAYLYLSPIRSFGCQQVLVVRLGGQTQALYFQLRLEGMWQVSK